MSEEVVPGMAEAIEGRREQLHLSPGDFAHSAGLTAQGLAPVRRGYRRQYQAKVRNGVARALRWPTDWYSRLIDGEDWQAFESQTISLPLIDGSDTARLNVVEERLDRIEEAVGRLLEREAR